MRKFEMTEKQVSLRNKILQFLKNENWRFDDTNWFEENLWSQFEISSMYDNSNMIIELELSFENEHLNFILNDHVSGREVFIVIKSFQNIVEVFKKVCDFKDSINSENFKDCINSLFEVTDSIFADDGTNNLVELSPNEL